MTVQQVDPKIEQQARLLASDNRRAEPDVTTVLWFPDNHEVRLIELTDQVPQSLDKDVHPFYFRASPQDKLPVPSAIAMIRVNERGRLNLPLGWGNWDDAIEL